MIGLPVYEFSCKEDNQKRLLWRLSNFAEFLIYFRRPDLDGSVDGGDACIGAISESERESVQISEWARSRRRRGHLKSEARSRHQMLERHGFHNSQCERRHSYGKLQNPCPFSWQNCLVTIVSRRKYISFSLSPHF